MTLEIEVLEDPARACAAMLVSASLGGGDIVITGGSTPAKAYEQFAEAANALGLGLERTTLWFSDERCVAPEDELSNYGMVKQALLERLGDGNPPTVRRMQGELGPRQGADEYEQALRDAGPPQFDLVLLGLGPDGHIASLFPEQRSLSESARLALGVEQAGLEPFVPRISLTLPALASAKQVAFLVTGDSKADAVAAAFGPDSEPDPHVPGSLLVPLAKEIKVLLDPAAAEQL
jgi:6-phosphogluconolactonase